MKEATKNKCRWLHLRLSEEEQNHLKQLFSDSTANSLSEYARQVLLAKPVYRSYVDTGQQEMLKTLAGLRKEMNSIGVNFNQLVRRLNMLPEKDIRDIIIAYESEHVQILKMINEIHGVVLKLSLQWLQK